MKRFFAILKVVAALAAIINLALIFLTDDYPAVFSAFSANADIQSEIESAGGDTPEAGAEEAPAGSFRFDPETLVYDGSGDLDLLAGVSFGDFSAAELKNRVFAKIRSGRSASAKIITYSIDIGDDTVEAERSLTLNNYSGPSLVLPDVMPDVPLSELDSAAAKMASAEGFTALDGYGNDISQTLSCSYRIDPTDISKVTFDFTVTNMFGDSDYASKIIAPLIDLPYIELLSREVTYSSKNPFPGYFDNIKSVKDTDGSSIGNLLHYSGHVDPEVPGTYAVTFTVTNAQGLSAIPVSMTVRITK